MMINTTLALARDLAFEMDNVFFKGGNAKRLSPTASTSGTKKWEKPIPGWIKLIRMLVYGNENHAAIASVARDWNGKWL